MVRVDKLGVPIYATPVPHILWEDLKLALGTAEFKALEHYMAGRLSPVDDGVTVEELENFIQRGSL